MAIWKQIVVIWQQSWKFSGANPKLFRPKVEFISRSQQCFRQSVPPSGHVKCFFDGSVRKFRQSSKRFGSKCIFEECWNVSAGSSINFAWKTKLYRKTNTFLIKTPQNFSGRLKCNFNKNDETLLSKLIFFSLESEVKKNMRTIHKETKKVLPTRRMHVWKRCWKL